MTHMHFGGRVRGVMSLQDSGKSSTFSLPVYLFSSPCCFLWMQCLNQVLQDEKVGDCPLIDLRV